MKKTQQKISRKTSSGTDRLARGLMWFLAIGGVGGLAIVSPPLFLFALGGFAPTIVALIVDRDPEKYAAISVGALSVAAMLPYGIDTLAKNRPILNDVYAWLVVYGAAAIGWAIYIVMPSLAVVLADLGVDMRQRELRRRQETLIKEWGPEVGNADR
ncbi:MAG: hypothetical protein HY057_12995 [Rhodospirillales bacterium]|nr:hypothetical protein [Rhodospirillales bacterium]